MQKMDKEAIDEMIHDKKIPIRIACMKPDCFPTVVSLWYVAIDQKIYCATQQTAKIVTYLEKNPICGFEIAADKPPYRGIRGEGTVKIIKEKGEEILNVLISKYLGEKNSKLSRFLKNNSKSEVAIEIIPKRTFNYDYSKRMEDV